MKKFFLKNHKFRVSSGFTFLEVTVAVFLIGVILVAVAASMTKAARSLWEAKTRFYAINMAQNCIENFNFENKKLDWKNFYAKPSISDLCTMKNESIAGTTAEESPMQYMCCESDCPPYLSSQSCVTSQAELKDVFPDIGTAPNEVGETEKALHTVRAYRDVLTDTDYEFKITTYFGTVPYRQKVLDLATNKFDVKPVRRKSVVVFIEVNWKKYGSTAAPNQYTITKQYLEFN